MHKTPQKPGAQRRKSPILRPKSGVVEYYGYRDYDATSGRWTSRDPIYELGGFNLYGFCLNHPINGIDIHGKAFWIPVIIIGIWLIEEANAPSPSDPPRPPRTDFMPPTPIDIVTVVVEDVAGIDIPPYIPSRKNIKCAIKKAESTIWKNLTNWRGKTKTNGKNGKDKEYYEWDNTHDDIEVYDCKGNHAGSMDPCNGRMYKPPVPGRKINL